MSDLVDRIYRAAKLDPGVYEEVEADKGAFKQAGLVVVFSSIAAGLGSISQGGLDGLVLGIVAALVSWFIWAYLTCIVGTRLLPEPTTEADYGQLLRTIGFASSPGLIRVLGLIPGIAPLVFIVAGVWMLAAMVVAVRQALDYKSTLRAVGVCLIGWVIQAVVLALFLALVR